MTNESNSLYKIQKDFTLRNGNSRGFTLIEVLVGLTIIGLLFGFGYVSFRDFARRQSLAGAAKSLVSDIRLAQTNALSGFKPDHVNCDTPNTLEAWRVGFTSTTQYRLVAVCSGGIVVAKTVDSPSDVVMTLPAVNPIIFKVLGQGNNIPLGSQASIVLTQVGTGSVQTIVIGSGGQVR
jgi:prepilin-type N-terminal cleavage/methylation domain-containing protein